MGRKIPFILIWLAVWQAVSVLLHGFMKGAGPVETAAAMAGMIASSGFWGSFCSSMIQILIGALLGAVLGIVCGFAGFLNPAVSDAASPLVSALKAVPPAGIALLLLFKGSGLLALVISFITVFPILYGSVFRGLEGTDQGLLEMAQVFRVPSAARLKYILIPEIRSKLAQAVPSAVGFAWKSAVAAEVIGQVPGSAGGSMYQAFAGGDLSRVMAWIVMLIIGGLVLEKGIGMAFALAAGTGSAHKKDRKDGK